MWRLIDRVSEEAPLLTVSDVLAMPVVRTAEPEVLAGRDQLERQVHWVHTTELADIGPLLRGGDLVLTTGIALPDAPAALTRFADGLADSHAAGLMVELGRRWSALPEPLVAACARAELPLVALRREVRFAAVAQAVGERLVDEQVAELREAQRVHETFTELSISEAGPEEILAATQRLAGSAVVLESERHRILDYRAGPGDAGSFLDDWERRSRRLDGTARTMWDRSNGWLVSRVGRPERGWGRLVIGAPSAPSGRLIAIAERAAAALAMHRLHDRSREGHLRRLHQELLIGLLTRPGDAETLRRIELAGLPAQGRAYVGLVLRPSSTPPSPPAANTLPAQLDELVAACLRATEVVRATSLVAAFEAEVRTLLAVPSRVDADRAADQFGEWVRDRAPAVIAAGTASVRLPEAHQSLREAMHVMAALPDAPDGLAIHRLVDVHLRGLLTLLAEDHRVMAFAERELAPLRDQPDLLRTLRALLEGGSKSAAASRLSISRPVLYERIARIERLLGIDLADAETRTSLHVAMMSQDALEAR